MDEEGLGGGISQTILPERSKANTDASSDLAGEQKDVAQ